MKIIHIFVVLVSLVICFHSTAQRHDNYWVLGDDSSDFPTDTLNGTVFVDFDEARANIRYPAYDTIAFNMWRDCITMSDSSGNLLFYANGVKINNAQHKIMAGSEYYNGYHFHNQYEDTGLPLTQGSIAVPAPGMENTYYILHGKIDIEYEPEFNLFTRGFYYTVIDMDADGGLGEVVLSSKKIINDTLAAFGYTAVRHANGRDWWVIGLGDNQRNKYYIVLVDPTGPHLHHIQDLSIATDAKPGVGQTFFTTDGSMLVRYGFPLYNEPTNLEILDFDRCTGMFSMIEQFEVEDNITAGCAISQNGQFLYTTNGVSLYQFDLFAASIESSMVLVGEYDGYRTETNFPSTFRNCWLAPDGRIYMTCANGMKPTHVIYHPDKKGTACTFKQRAFDFPYANSNSIPNHPNYRLGPIDGGACDTLDIDNVPLARWRHDDVYRQVEFTNLSNYEPTQWLWTFGDGQSSSDTSPIHMYGDTGYYEVCLTVTNTYGSDTRCRTIHVTDSLSAVQAIDDVVKLQVFPNPTIDDIQVRASEHLGWTDCRIYAIDGKLIHTARIEVIKNRAASLDISHIKPGMYMIELWKDNLRIAGERIVVQK